MMNLGTILRPVAQAGVIAVSDQLVLCATHHDCVLLDQAVGDALGSEGWAVRRQAAFEASLGLIGAIARRLSIEGDREILELAAELYGTLGLGQLSFDISATGGEVIGTDLIFGGGAVERSNDRPRARHQVDAFAAGFAAAAASIAYPSDWGAFEAEETRCVARGDTSCLFGLSRRPSSFQHAEGLTRTEAEQLLGPDPPAESDPSPMEVATRELIASCVASDRGIIRVGGARFAVLPASYRAQLAFDTMVLVEKRTAPRDPRLTGRLARAFLELVKEATRSGMFHLIGDLYDSAPLRDAFGPPATDPQELAHHLTSVAAALGWGALSLSDLVPGERLVLSATLTPEAVYYAARHGGTPHSRLPGLQGLAEAIALLVTCVNFSTGEGIPRGLYQRLALQGPTFRVEETRSILSGDRECEITVEIDARA